MNSIEIPLEACSIDLQWQIQQSNLTLQRRVDWSIAAVTSALVACVVIQPLNDGMRSVIASINSAKQTADKTAATVQTATEFFSPDFSQTPKQGEKIVGYEVSSVYGKRDRPCPKCSAQHRGIDLALPEGTQLFAIGKAGEQVSVQCKTDPASGLWAAVRSPSFPDLSFEYLHLSQCADGKQPAGSVIAMSGNSGHSTGPHLHFQIRKLSKVSDENKGLYPPEKGFIFWSMTGSQPTSPFARGNQ